MAKKKNNSNKKGSSTGSTSSTNAVGTAGTDIAGDITSIGDDVTSIGTSAATTRNNNKNDNNNDNDDIVPDSDELIDDENTTVELELYQVDLGDMIKIKQVMDETVAGCIIENHMVPEDYKWDNIKLLIMTIACTFAMIAQMIPIPFPDSRPILGICGILYFVFSTILQFITTFIDKDSILWTLPMTDNTDNNTTKITNPLMKQYGFTVRTSLERFSEWYTVTIEFHIPKKKDTATINNSTTKSPFVQQRWSIAQFFDKDGYFDEIGVMDEVDTLYLRFVNEQYDTVPLGDVPPPKRKQD